MAIALMMGWVIWRITQLLGGGVVMPIVLTGAIWGGSLLAMLTVLWFHSKRGKIGVAHIIEQSKEADKLMVQRDQHARNILMQGFEMRDKLNLNAIRFRVWALLKRTQRILQTELQPHPTEVIEALGYASEEDDTTRKHARRDEFLAETRRLIGPFPIIDSSLMQEDIAKLARAWVFGSQEGILVEGEAFCDLWHRLCATDRQNMGYHPAKLFINELHSFVVRFLEAMIHVMNHNIIENKSEEIRQDFEEWFNLMCYEQFAHFATAAIDGTVINSQQQLPCFVFVAKEKSVDVQSLRTKTIEQDIAIQSSEAMRKFPILALRYQEYCLDFALTDGGQLTFKEAKDA